MVRGAGGVEAIVRRGLTIVRARWCMAIVRATAATGDIVRETTVRRCRRIARASAVPAVVVSRVMDGRGIVREIALEE